MSARFAGLIDSFLLVPRTLCQFILSFLQGQESQSLGTSPCLSVSIRVLPFLECFGFVCCFAVLAIWTKNKLYSGECWNMHVGCWCCLDGNVMIIDDCVRLADQELFQDWRIRNCFKRPEIGSEVMALIRLLVVSGVVVALKFV